MSSRAAFRLALSLWGVCVTLAAISVLFALLNSFDTEFSAYLPILVASAVSFSTVGALVASGRPRNPIGWLFLASGYLFATEAFAGEYGFYEPFGAPGSLPGGVFAIWVASWAWLLAGSVVLFSFLLFPDGRLPSRRWRVVGLIVAFVICLEPAQVALRPGPLESVSPLVENPLGVEGVSRVLDLVGAFLAPLWFVFALAPVAALAVRFRRADEEGRQQIKWVAYAVALLAGVITATTVWPPLDGSVAGLVLFLVGYQAIPVAVGVAILRYRLYDIDVIINRTLVYGSLTASLAAVYVGSVVALQYALRTLTGEGSQLAVVASTLAIAALFNPLRRRIQSFIDRRFYRKKYDAQETLRAYSATLRDETDLERLEAELISAVRNTVRPEHASLWLKPLEK